jgi:hypothetical protein
VTSLLTKEHYDLIAQFDKTFRGRRLDKESRDLWPRGQVYQDGAVNELFLAFRHGYSYRDSLS